MGISASVHKLVTVFIILPACLGATISQAQSSGSAPPMREACLSDFKKYCTGMPPGSERVLVCLRRMETNLSIGCRVAIEGMGGFEGGMMACAKDRDQYCPSVRGDELALCLKDHRADLSSDCQSFLVQRAAKEN